jgi:hypothetical protein
MILFGIFIFLCLAAFSVAITPLTFIWSICTGQSYSQVCDSSDTLYKLNVLGVWSIATIIGFLLILNFF